VAKTILIADDDMTLLHGLGQTLEKEGYHPVLARDGAEALKKVQEEHPDLIILDIQMPKVHGYAFLFELRKIEGGQNIPILILTSNQDMGDIFAAEGVKEYLIKPCSPQTVLMKIKQYL
jgi:DNA-binding response OmpR family regulator